MRPRWPLALISTLLLGLPGLTGSIAQAEGTGVCGWRRVPSEDVNEDGDNILFGVAAVTSADVWAVGRQGRLPYSTLVEHWDGTAWTVVPSPNPSTEWNELVAVSAASANDVWAVGTFFNTRSNATETLVIHWDGTAWTVTPSPSPGPTSSDLIDVVATGPDDAWAVGSTLDSDPPYPSPPLVLHWDGQGWEVVPGPDVGDNGVWRTVTANSPSDVWVAGWAGGPITAHWDGLAWTVFPTEDESGLLFDITALPTGEAWVAGYRTNPGAYETTLVEHWDGTGWTRERTPSIGNGPNNLMGLDAISAEDIWAVGSRYSFDDGALQVMMLHWDGARWTATGKRHGPSDTSQLSDVAAVSSTDVWATGWGPGQDRSLTMHYGCSS